MELLGFFVQEFEVRSALIFNVFRLFGFVLPIRVGFPLIVIVFFFVIVAQVEVLFLGSLLAI
jgi:hypothetical protein